jgi:hypothetical protein
MQGSLQGSAQNASQKSFTPGIRRANKSALEEQNGDAETRESR